MEEKILKILRENKIGHAKAHYLKHELLNLFNVSKRQLIENALDDMKGVHSEYHKKCLESYLIDGC